VEILVEADIHVRAVLVNQPVHLKRILHSVKMVEIIDVEFGHLMIIVEI
jgi:hypothetical protein